MTLGPGDLMPQFAVTTLDGAHFDYSEIWQRRNLLLIVLPETMPSDDVKDYVSGIAGRRSDLEEFDTTCVVTAGPVAGVKGPAVIIADRWGEIYVAATADSLPGLPGVTGIVEALRYVAHECPECQGEAR